MSMQSVPVSPVEQSDGKKQELIVYHHSNLFYWWPVWLLGFVLAGVTYVEDHHMAVVPPGTVAVKKTPVPGLEGDRALLVYPAKEDHPVHINDKNAKEIAQPSNVWMSQRKGLGTLFVAVVLIVIIITNVTMRGLWSILVIMTLVMVSIILYIAELWETIFEHVRLLAIHINMGGYLVISLVLFTAWIINFFLFDRQTYMVFAPGQVRARLTIGGGEIVYGTTGIAVQKQRGDLFRHFILGFGSGDLIVRISGLQTPIEMPNVLNVGRVVRKIEQLVKEQVVVRRTDA